MAELVKEQGALAAEELVLVLEVPLDPTAAEDKIPERTNQPEAEVAEKVV